MHNDIHFTTKNDSTGKRYFVVLPHSPKHKELIETSETVYWLLKSFQREDWKQERAARRYLEKLSLTDDELLDRNDIFVSTPEELLYKSILTDNLRRAFLDLPSGQARRFLLHHGLDLTYRQVADAEGCSINTVKQSIRLAKVNLKKILKKNVL